MTTIGYATLAIIPSLKGVSEEINKQLGNKLGPLGKLGGAQFGKGVADGLKSTEGDIKRATDAYEKLKDKATDSLGKVRTAEAQLQALRAKGVTDAGRIAAAEERLATARRNSTRSSKEAEAAHSALADAQKTLSSGTDDLRGKFGSLDGVAAKLGTGLAAVGAAAAGAAVAGVAALGAAAVVAGRELYDLGAAFDDISDTLRIKTGATGATLDALNQSVLNIGKSVPVALGDLGAVVAETNRNLHLTGPALDDVAGSVANLGRLTGEAVDMRGLGKAFRGFGVDAKDMTPALDSLYQASQRSGISVNELVAAVNKGAPALRQLGLSFGESAAMAAQFEEIGLDPDKGMAGLAKGVATLAKETGQTGKQALQGFLDQVRQLATVDQAGALNLSNKMFGAKGGALFFDAIKSGALDLDTLSASLSGAGDTIAQASAGTADWAEKWQLLQNNAETSLKPLGDMVFGFVNESLTALSDWVTAHKGEIIDFFVSVGDMAIATGDAIHGFVSSTVYDMSLLVDLAAKIVGAMATVDELLDHIPGMGGNQQEAESLRKTQNSLEDLSKNLKGTSEGVEKSRDAWDRFKDQLHAVGENAKASGENLDALRAKIEKVPQADRGWFDFSGSNSGGGSGARGTVTSEEASRLGGGTINTSILTSLRGTNPGAKLTSGMTDHSQDSGEHPKGKAIDVDPSRENLAWAWANRDKLSMIIYDDPNYVWYNMHGERAEGAAARAIYGAATMKGHGDHIHLAALSEVGGTATSGNLAALGTSAGSGAGGQVPDWDAIAQKESGGDWAIDHGDADSTGGLQIQTPTWLDFGGGAITPTAGQATKEQQIAIAEKILAAQGPQAWAGGKNFVWKAGSGGAAGVSSPFDFSRNTLGAVGPGVPGVNEEGAAGIWKADPKAVREADERAADAVARIADADAAVALALARINELDADASESQKLSAQETLRKAQEDTGKARREARDAQADLDEAKKGKFTEDKKSAGSGLKMPSLTNFSGIGSALGEFAGGQIGSALSTFGIGDSPPWLQAVGGLMGGISVGGPVSDAWPGVGDTHGGTGAQPGPGGVTYNINNGGGNDDLITLLRRREQELGAMLGRF